MSTVLKSVRQTPSYPLPTTDIGLLVGDVGTIPDLWLLGSLQPNGLVSAIPAHNVLIHLAKASDERSPGINGKAGVSGWIGLAPGAGMSVRLDHLFLNT